MAKLFSRILRRLLRRRVPAGVGRGRPGETGGSAGVREPRHPKPTGPRSSAGVKPDPQPAQMITLPDPRQ
jgi:hypothetical protein